MVVYVSSLSKPFISLLEVQESNLLADGLIIDQEDLEDIEDEMEGADTPAVLSMQEFEEIFETETDILLEEQELDSSIETIDPEETDLADEVLEPEDYEETDLITTVDDMDE